MKITFALTILALSLSSSAFASSKICYGSTKSDDTKGLILNAEISRKSVAIKPVKGETYDGTYETYGTKVNGRDGKTYLEYKGENSDYQDVIMIDSELLKEGTTGLLQIRARGEGFFNSVFVCKDSE
jgi:hypothetical protein